MTKKLELEVNDFPRELSLPCECANGDETPYIYEYSVRKNTCAKYRCVECTNTEIIPNDHLRAYLEDRR